MDAKNHTIPDGANWTTVEWEVYHMPAPQPLARFKHLQRPVAHDSCIAVDITVDASISHAEKEWLAF